jgi:predicted flavoprotein YhiN
VEVGIHVHTHTHDMINVTYLYLHLCIQVLNVDGVTGGFNFQVNF